MTYLISFCYLPALQTKLFLWCMLQGWKPSPIERFCKYVTQALQPSASTKSRHSPRAGSPESRQASQMSFRGEYDVPARILHTLARSKTNTSTSHCSPAQALPITPKQRAARVLPLTSAMGTTVTPSSARAAAWAERKSVKGKNYSI